MALPMTDERLAVLAERAELYVLYGDKAALSGDDVAELVAELHAARAQVAHLTALCTRDRERRGLMGTVPR